MLSACLIGSPPPSSSATSKTTAVYEANAWTEKAINFSTGMFRPVLQEASNLKCTITYGEIPKDMPAGTYYRNGPNPYFPPEKNDPYHYFDGDGMIAAFTIPETTKETITFSHKWVKTERLQW